MPRKKMYVTDGPVLNIFRTGTSLQQTGIARLQTMISVKEENYHLQWRQKTENMHSLEMERGGWQSILNKFKKYAEVN